MNHIIRTLLFIFAILFSTSVFSADKLNSPFFKIDSISNKIVYQPLQVKLGFNLGWEFPYSIGMECSFLFSELVDANIGCGIGMSGFKVGVGARIYPIRKKKTSPMIGAYFYHASGLGTLNVNVNEDAGTYSIPSDNAVLVNAGFRTRFKKGHYLIAGIGYSIPYKGERAQYQSGSESSSLQSFADAFRVGGFSINVGILIKLTKGYYRTFE